MSDPTDVRQVCDDWLAANVAADATWPREMAEAAFRAGWNSHQAISAEQDIKGSQQGDPVCRAESLSGWHCCRIGGYPGQHVGATAYWGTLAIWPASA